MVFFVLVDVLLEVLKRIGCNSFAAVRLLGRLVRCIYYSH
jgi:hypothetical protein